jgi:hypothetical protein
MKVGVSDAVGVNVGVSVGVKVGVSDAVGVYVGVSVGVNVDVVGTPTNSNAPISQ